MNDPVEPAQRAPALLNHGVILPLQAAGDAAKTDRVDRHDGSVRPPSQAAECVSEPSSSKNRWRPPSPIETIGLYKSKEDADGQTAERLVLPITYGQPPSRRGTPRTYREWAKIYNQRATTLPQE